MSTTNKSRAARPPKGATLEPTVAKQVRFPRPWFGPGAPLARAAAKSRRTESDYIRIAVEDAMIRDGILPSLNTAPDVEVQP